MYSVENKYSIYATKKNSLLHYLATHTESVYLKIKQHLDFIFIGVNVRKF